MAVTIKNIAKLAGVSIGTVDRALNNRGRIDPQVSERIKEIATSLNYKPNIVAKSLAIRKKKLKIAVILNTDKNIFFDDVINGVNIAREEIKDFGISVSVERCKDFDFEDQLRLIDEAVNRSANAIAIVPIDNALIKERLAKLYKSGFPVLFLTSIIENEGYLGYVGCNYKVAGEMGAALVNIIANGETNLLIFSNNFEQMLGNKRRIDSLVKRIEKDYNNINIESVISMKEEYDVNYSIAKEAFLKYPNTDILVCPGAATSEAVINVVKDLGYYKKIKIITYDLSDVVKEGLLDRGIIASITQNPREQGYRAIKTLFEYLVTNSISESNVHYIQTQIVFRENLSEVEGII